jgi:hypothetical protein
MQGPERRFDEAEVDAILERATTWQEPGRQVALAGEGLTLGQLQDIGREIGIAPHVIAEAADALDDRAPTVTRRILGLPLGVERVVRLRRRLTDEEWERLVVELRETFDVRGVTRQEGSLRQWTNGNLQALLEPTDGAQRIRLRTVKGNALGLMAAGAGILGGAGAAVAATALGGAPGEAGALTALTLLAAGGAALLGGTALRLFPWARRRRAQMTEVAARIAARDRLAPPPAIAPLPAGPPPAAP